MAADLYRLAIFMDSSCYLELLTEAALDAALAAWRKAHPEFSLLVLLSEESAASIPTLQAACRGAGIALAGAVFPALLVGNRLVRQGALLLPLVGTPAPLLVEGVSRPDRVEALAAQLADYVDTVLGDSETEATLFCIFDAMVPNIATHLDAWYLTLADRVHYAGVNAGSERFVPIPCLFDNQRCIGDGVLLQLLPQHDGAVLEHGYRVPDHVITATSASGNRIVQIDWRPALEVYGEMMASQYGVSIDRGNFYTYAVHFPFGILRADGEVLVRIPVALDEAGGIICVGEIPPNSVLTLLDAGSAGQGVARFVASLTALPVSAQDTLLLFYCAGRRMHLGQDGMDAELAELAGCFGEGRLRGALSLGEIGAAVSGGYPLFHNATLVGIPWRSRWAGQ
ncbi:hypothetical protein AZSI13_20260 [Azospira sp. I13]|jgi:hypothetical protein|uniref:FIST signal transduction protein n=1 Tax=Azospira sp. I13 TaxID=1765050 RepID=UPI000D42B6F6|nr:FIST C-terminal domain-containing protein [Azospira sp. I13]GBG02699.1 hypothetical protein AZSI13_20260 [Azospira sp. I13]